MPKVAFAGGSDHATFRLPVLELDGRLEVIDGHVKVGERTGKPAKDDPEGRYTWEYRDLKADEWKAIVASGDAARCGFVKVG